MCTSHHHDSLRSLPKIQFWNTMAILLSILLLSWSAVDLNGCLPHGNGRSSIQSYYVPSWISLSDSYYHDNHVCLCLSIQQSNVVSMAHSYSQSWSWSWNWIWSLEMVKNWCPINLCMDRWDHWLNFVYISIPFVRRIKPYANSLALNCKLLCNSSCSLYDILRSCSYRWQFTRRIILFHQSKYYSIIKLLT